MSAPLSDGRHRFVLANVPMTLFSETGDVPICAELAYSTRDPFAVRATFRRKGHSPVVWTFARDLVQLGVVRPIGLGDVRVSPEGSAVILRLSSPEGTARLAASATDLEQFVLRTLHLVPAGGESAFFNLDAELAVIDPAISAGGNG